MKEEEVTFTHRVYSIRFESRRNKRERDLTASISDNNLIHRVLWMENKQSIDIKREWESGGKVLAWNTNPSLPCSSWAASFLFISARPKAEQNLKLEAWKPRVFGGRDNRDWKSFIKILRGHKIFFFLLLGLFWDQMVLKYGTSV